MTTARCQQNSESRQNKSSFLFGGRKGRYLPLTTKNVGSGMGQIRHRIIMLGDYASGISLLRNELIQLNPIKNSPFSDAECCTIITEDGHELQMWLFVDLHNFELFCMQCTENIDCCITCYSITIGQTYRNVVEKVQIIQWLPEFMKKFPGKPIILCALNDCEVCTCAGGIHETIFQHEFSFRSSYLIQIDVSIFDKRNLKCLYDCIRNISNSPRFKQRQRMKMKSCVLM